MIQLEKTNGFKFLSELESNSADMIFTDPPYWTLNKWRNVGTTTRLGGNSDKDKQTGWFDTINSEDLWHLMLEMFRVLKKDRHAFIMCDGQTLKWVLGYAEEAGFNYYKPLVWDKVSLGMGYHLRNRHEFIVMLDKGKNRKPKNFSIPDIITVPMIKGGYPTEKPQGLIDIFVEQFTEENELVIDPFFGSGVVAVSCKHLGRMFKGSDISDEAIKCAQNRLNEKKLFE
jgi:site-specific DNA-methyltransferase (adenine-specific)